MHNPFRHCWLGQISRNNKTPTTSKSTPWFLGLTFRWFYASLVSEITSPIMSLPSPNFNLEGGMNAKFFLAAEFFAHRKPWNHHCLRYWVQGLERQCERHWGPHYLPQINVALNVSLSMCFMIVVDKLSTHQFI